MDVLVRYLVSFFFGFGVLVLVELVWLDVVVRSSSGQFIWSPVVSFWQVQGKMGVNGLMWVLGHSLRIPVESWQITGGVGRTAGGVGRTAAEDDQQVDRVMDHLRIQIQGTPILAIGWRCYLRDQIETVRFVLFSITFIFGEKSEGMVGLACEVFLPIWFLFASFWSRRGWIRWQRSRFWWYLSWSWWCLSLSRNES